MLSVRSIGIILTHTIIRLFLYHENELAIPAKIGPFMSHKVNKDICRNICSYTKSDFSLTIFNIHCDILLLSGGPGVNDSENIYFLTFRFVRRMKLL